MLSKKYSHNNQEYFQLLKKKKQKIITKIDNLKSLKVNELIGILFIIITKIPYKNK